MSLRNLARQVAFTAACLLLIAAPARGLDPSRAITQTFLRKWQVPQGLPQATINKIVQTSDGYLWLGTQSGLYRFDGIRFVAAVPKFANEEDESRKGSAANLWIQDLCEDQLHNLWIATDDGGLIRMGENGASWERIKQSQGLPSPHVHCLLCDRRGVLWIGTEEGLAQYFDGRITSQVGVPGLFDEAIVALAQKEDGTVWIASPEGRISVWKEGQYSIGRLPSLPQGSVITSLLATNDGALWIGTTTGLIRIDKDRERRLLRADGLASDAIECLARARDGTVWVGTKDGISWIQGSKIETFRAPDGLSHSVVHTICEDHEGGLWVGTKHGLNQFIDRRTIPITTSEGLPGNDTGPVFQDKSGTIWVGTLGQGLARYDGQGHFQTLTMKDGLPSNTIVALADGERNELWIGTDRGLCRLHDSRIDTRFTTVEGLPSDAITALCHDRNGVLWIGTANGLALLEAGASAKVRKLPQIPRQSIVAMLDAGSQGLLIATDGSPGLFRNRGGATGSFEPEPGIHSAVDAFCIDAEGAIWIATHGRGLGLLDGRNLRMLTVKDGLYDNDLFGIVADHKDRMWMACSRGIFFVPRSELKDCLAGRRARITGVPFSPTDAQRTIECQDDVQPAVFRMRDGRIWFSTIRGVTIADPANIQRKLPPIPVLIEDVQVNGQEFAPQRIPQLPPGRTNLAFRYTALSYMSPSRLLFRHKLEGFDKDWINAGSRREAFYTNLPPGHYRFRVEACMPDGEWYETAQPVELRLSPHFYQTIWFAFATVVAIGLAIWLAFRLRVMRVKAHWNTILAERTRIARELHDTLLQGFSGVTMQMQALAARLHAATDRQTLEEIIRDAGTCLKEARRSVSGLRNSAITTHGLSEAITQLTRQLSETSDIRLRQRLAANVPPLPSDVEDNLLRIVQEALLNAVRHANAGTIEVTLEHAPQRLTLTVSDDGVGFDTRQSETTRPGHYGLIGMRERAAQIGASLHLDSEPGGGVKVRVELPLPATRAAIHTVAESIQRDARQLKKEQSLP